MAQPGEAMPPQEKKRFFALADRLASTTDRKEQQRLKEELARLTFGD